MFSEKVVDVKTFAIAIIFILFFYWLWSRRHFYTFTPCFPVKQGVPILGILHKIRYMDRALYFCGKYFDECKSDSIFCWWGVHPVLMTRDPVLAEKVLTSSKLLNKASTLYTAVNYAFQGGLGNSSVSEWRFKRKLINPVFRQKVLLSFFPIFNRAKNNLIEEFGKIAKSEKCNEVHVSKILQRTILGVGLETVMGRRNPKNDTWLGDCMKAYSQIFRRTAVHTMYSFLSVYIISKFDRTHKKVLHVLWKIVTDELEDRLNEKNHTLAPPDDDNSEMRPTIFVEQVLRLHKEGQFSWQDVISESNTMMMASIETSSNTLLSTIIMLAMHPSVQERLYEEITGVFTDNDINVEYAHFEKLPYLDMVVHEMLRLAPAVPLIGRQVTEPTELSEGIIVPKGVEILVSIYDIHRNKAFWGPDANKFDPDNFLPCNREKRHPYAFMPFSKGIRNCIGWRYAIYGMKIMIVGMVYNFHFGTNFKFEDLRMLNHVSLTYKREPLIKITSRTAH